MRTESVVLGDLLARPDWGLELVAGGPEALERRVAGAHTVEIEHPTRWLDRDWVMLTTGVRLRGHADAQRDLVAELDEAGVAALGFGIELVFKRVPPALAREAQARDFPVFAVPFDTAFREIVGFVNGTLISAEVRAYQRVSSLQRHLLDALQEPDPGRTMLARLAGFLDATVLVVSADGQLETATGPAPVDALWERITGGPGTVVDVEAEGWHAVAAPIVIHGNGAPEQWLIVAGPPPGLLSRLARPAAQATAPLLAAVAHLADAAREQERALRGALLEDLLEPVAARDARALAARAAMFGVDFTRPARVLLVQRDGGKAGAEARDAHRGAAGADARNTHRGTAGGEGRDAARADLTVVTAELEEMLAKSATPHLVCRRKASVVALAQGPADNYRERLAALVDRHPGIRAGLGRPVDAVGAVHHSLRDAEVAIARVAHDLGTRMLDYQDFDLATLLVAEADPDRLLPKVEELIAPVRAQPPLFEALVAYLDRDQDIPATADALHLHPNSLRYRLSRVEQLLDRSLKQPSTIAALTIALIASPRENGAGTVSAPAHAPAPAPEEPA